MHIFLRSQHEFYHALVKATDGKRVIVIDAYPLAAPEVLHEVCVQSGNNGKWTYSVKENPSNGGSYFEQLKRADGGKAMFDVWKHIIEKEVFG